MTTLRLATLALVTTLSGLPLGSVICGAACAPPQGQSAPGCHEHGHGAGNGPVVTGIHLCDQDASVVPVIVRPAFTLAYDVGDAPDDTPSIGAMRLAPPALTWMYPPGLQRSRVLAAEGILRI